PRRGAVRIGIRSPALSDSGCVRLARSHQPAGDGDRRELDLSPAVAGRPARRDTGRARAPGPVARVVAETQPVVVARGRALRARWVAWVGWVGVARFARGGSGGLVRFRF